MHQEKEMQPREVYPSKGLPVLEMAEDVEIGPYSILEGRMKLGSGTRIRSHAFMQGPLVMGESNEVWPFACIGSAPQTSHFDPDSEGPGTVIGDHNIFREHSSIHRSIHSPTHCYRWMVQIAL